jgi:hypothetical protein
LLLNKISQLPIITKDCIDCQSLSLKISNSHYETDFGVSSAFGAGNTKIGFLKVRQRRTFKKSVFIMRIAV